MDDLALVATLDDSSTIYVTPLHRSTYQELLEGDALGGSGGYFVVREKAQTAEILAKAPTFAAAEELFNLIVRPRARAA